MSNERNIFEGVMHNFKFCLLTYKKDKPKDYITTSFRIYVHEAVHPTDLESFLSSEDSKLKIPIKVIKEFAPDSLSILEFKEQIDLDIAKRIVSFPSLGKFVEGSFKLALNREFDMTGDSKLFQTKFSKGSLRLFEGKMIHQFNDQFSNEQYWIDEKQGRSAIAGAFGKDTGQKLEYQDYRIGMRAIGGSANERGLIATVLPKNIFCGNSLLVNTTREKEDFISNSNKLLLAGFLNSYPVDYCIRQMVATNINMFYIYQLHIPRLLSSDKWYKPIIEKAARLICTTEEFADLWLESMGTNWAANVAIHEELERNKLRAELDAIIAHLYELNEAEYLYILSTFPVVDKGKKDLTIKYFKDLAPQFQKASSPTNTSLLEHINKGENKNLEFKSTLCYDLKENARKPHIEHSVLKTIAAFLNSEGGTLLIGVTDEGQIHGLEDDLKVLGSKGDPRDNFNKAFDNLISNNFGREIHRLVHLTLEPIDGKLVAKVEIKEKATAEVFLVNKEKNSIEEFYVRLNASSVPLSGKEQSKYIKGHWK
ncbi:MAG: putative DNA binding domain-containing protein [Flammeovirgaceae bacterium]|nr:putative DNA binding domain-containing protein [Flammeovirgaceae bacterium]